MLSKLEIARDLGQMYWVTHTIGDSLVNDLIPVGLNLILLEVLKRSFAAVCLDEYLS